MDLRPGEPPGAGSAIRTPPGARRAGATASYEPIRRTLLDALERSEIAAEHVAWARRSGLTPEEVLEGFGVKCLVPMGWPEVRSILIDLQAKPPRRPASPKAA